MDLMPENPIQPKQKSNNSTKIILIVVIVFIFLLIGAAAGVWVYSQKLSQQQFKVTIDGLSNSKASSIENMFIINNGKVYTSIEGICDFVSYKYYPGEYGQYTEDKTKCYVTNSKERVSFAVGSNQIRKTPLLDKDSESQTFTIEEDVILKGNSLYVGEEGFMKGFNSLIQYNSETNTVTIATLPYLTKYYEENKKNACLEKSKLDNYIIFNNEKALLYNLLVIQDASTGLFGVANLSNEGNVIITARYKSIEYIEGNGDFIVTTEDNKVGIIGNDGITKVKPTYDSIQEIDKDIGLYLVISNNKQGVINRNGKIIIYQDYDKIGLESGKYDDPNVTNRYLLYGTCIPVKLNNKWGIIDKDGNKIVPIEYDGFGCREVTETGLKNTNGSVLVPELKAIVVEKDIKAGNATVKKYGLISSTGNLMINIVADAAYSTTVENQTTYYVRYNNEAIDIVKYIREQQNGTNQVENNYGDATVSVENNIASEQ